MERKQGNYLGSCSALLIGSFHVMSILVRNFPIQYSTCNPMEEIKWKYISTRVTHWRKSMKYSFCVVIECGNHYKGDCDKSFSLSSVVTKLSPLEKLSKWKLREMDGHHIIGWYNWLWCTFTYILLFSICWVSHLTNNNTLYAEWIDLLDSVKAMHMVTFFLQHLIGILVIGYTWLFWN